MAQPTLMLQDVIAAAGPNLSDAESQELEKLGKYGDIFLMKCDDCRRTDECTTI
jgi:hypothetical protein